MNDPSEGSKEWWDERQLKPVNITPRMMAESGSRHPSREVLGSKDVLILVSPHPFSDEHAARMMGEFERVGLRNRVLIMDRQNLEILVVRGGEK